MKLRFNLIAAASAAPALALCPPATAEDIDSDRDTAIETATVNDGAADDVTIVSGVTVELENGTVVTVNSNNSVTNVGTITIEDADGAVGVRVLGGFTGRIDNQGSILLTEDYEREDEDEDGTLDGPVAQGSGRTGILIEGPPVFTGDVRNTGSIQVEGNDSLGVSLQTDLDGSFVQGGTISVLGDRSVGADLAGDISGDVRATGSIGVIGEESSGVVIGGDVSGGVSVGGYVSATGFQYSGASNYYDPDEIGDDYEPSPLDEDDLKTGGPAFVVAGGVAHGVLINGAVGGGDADDDTDGDGDVDDDDEEDDAKDIKGDFDENRSAGTITSIGSAPAVLISPDLSSASSGDIVIGLVVENVRDTLDDNDDDDYDAVIATFLEDYGFINRGTVSANGLNIGFEANAIVVTGSQDGTRSTIIEGGLFNSGTITATAYEADATALRFGAGARTQRLDNAGNMSATAYTEADHNVTVLLIEAGSMMSALSNSGSIGATVTGDGGAVVAIRDLSGTLVSIDNTGAIYASYLADGDDDDGDDDEDDNDEHGRGVAIDLSGHGAGEGAAIIQYSRTPTEDTNDDGVIDEDDVSDPGIAGDILLGAGDDRVEVGAGVVYGDIAFGDGADSFSIDGGAIFSGRLSDADGQLDIAVGEGEMNLAEREDIVVTSVSLRDGSRASFSVDLRGDSTTNTRIVASDVISISDGAQIAPAFVGVGSTTEAQLIELMRAEGGLSLTDGQSIADNLAIATPYIFDTALATASDGPADSVVMTIRRLSAGELGMTANRAAAYDPLMSIVELDEEVLSALVNQPSGEGFYAAYDQFFPEYSSSAIQFAVANMDGAVGAVGTRLDAVRGERSGAGSVWMQEFGQFIDRESTPTDLGYRGQGFGFAAGADRPLGPFYAVGLNVVGASSQIDEPAGYDTPLSVATAQVGAYAAANVGDLLFDFHAGAGADFFASERRVQIMGEDDEGEGVILVNREALGDWKGHHATASARLAYDAQYRRLFARPALSVDYLRLDEEAYRESGGGDAIDLAVDARSSELLSTTASLTLGGVFGDPQRSWWSPRVRVGYRSESMGSASYTTASFLSGGDPFTLYPDDLPESGGLFGFSFAAGSRYSSFVLDYDGDLRDGFVRHGVRVAFRFVF